HYKLRILAVGCLGASFRQGTVSSIPIGSSISPEGFLLLILLLVEIIVTVVIVVVILIVVVAIVRVVIAIIGVVVVVGGVFIIKLSFVIIGNLVGLLYPNRLGLCIPPRQGSSLCFQDCSNTLCNQLLDSNLGHSWVQRKEYKTLRDRHGNNGISDLIGGLDTKSGGGVIDLTGNEDPTDENEDTGMDDSTGVSTSLGGEISSREKKFQESDIGDCNNIGDGSKTDGRAIIT
nr:hypothetical protein [Tanacetum cinerariifolium]